MLDPAVYVESMPLVKPSGSSQRLLDCARRLRMVELREMRRADAKADESGKSSKVRVARGVERSLKSLPDGSQGLFCVY